MGARFCHTLCSFPPGEGRRSLGSPIFQHSGRCGSGHADPHTLWLRGSLWSRRGWRPAGTASTPAPVNFGAHPFRLTENTLSVQVFAPSPVRLFYFSNENQALSRKRRCTKGIAQPRGERGAHARRSARRPTVCGACVPPAPGPSRLRRRHSRPFVETARKNCPEIGASQFAPPSPH